MKRPTIKQAKKYFENVKTVQICNSSKELEIDPETFNYSDCNGINEIANNEYLMTGNDYNCVWAENCGYAKILTYKK